MTDERRVRSDRRHRDVGPPAGWGERRCRSERRLPQAVEGELSAEEFERYFGKTPRQGDSGSHAQEAAAEIFGRMPR